MFRTPANPGYKYRSVKLMFSNEPKDPNFKRPAYLSRSDLMKTIVENILPTERFVGMFPCFLKHSSQNTDWDVVFERWDD